MAPLPSGRYIIRSSAFQSQVIAVPEGTNLPVGWHRNQVTSAARLWQITPSSAGTHHHYIALEGLGYLALNQESLEIGISQDPFDWLMTPHTKEHHRIIQDPQSKRAIGLPSEANGVVLTHDDFTDDSTQQWFLETPL